jgi:hypothetical protein
MVSDLVTHELDYLLGQLKANPNINMKEDWKLLTLFIGANDLCSACTNQSYLQPGMKGLREGKNVRVRVCWVRCAGGASAEVRGWWANRKLKTENRKPKTEIPNSKTETLSKFENRKPISTYLKFR